VAESKTEMPTIFPRVHKIASTFRGFTYVFGIRLSMGLIVKLYKLENNWKKKIKMAASNLEMPIS